MKRTLILFGLLLILIQFNFPAIPDSWDRVFYVVTGLVMLFFAFFNRRVSLSAKDLPFTGAQLESSGSLQDKDLSTSQEGNS